MAVLTVSLLQRNFTVYVNKVPVVDADLMATNGVVHAVNAIIRPLGKPRPLLRVNPAPSCGSDPLSLLQLRRRTGSRRTDRRLQLQ